ncbi:MAG: hypothetical protein GXO85_16680 [Chlorobi bacterium]|nr:hypothetical protein [Chlorobiota bacterium]
MDEHRMSVYLDSLSIMQYASFGIIVLLLWFVFLQKRYANNRLMLEMMNNSSVNRREFLRGEEEINRPEQEELAAALKEKKKQLLNLPNLSFHYADKTRVKNFYTDYFREPTVESMIKELVTETSSEIKGSLPKILESKLNGGNVNKWISTIKLPETSVNGMFLKYQSETLKNNQVKLDLELLDVELSDVNQFQEIIDKLHKELEFIVDKSAVEDNILRLKERAAERTISKLELANGWVIIRGAFTIEQDQGFYLYRYEHPVNQYLTDPKQIVMIEARVPVDAIEPHVAVNYKQSIGAPIPITIYGEVWQPISRGSGLMTLTITPLVIY